MSIKPVSLVSSAVCAVLAALVVVLGTLFAPKGSYYITAALVVACALVPAFASFESCRPSAREVALTAVLCALAVASRAAFAWLPGFKPLAAVVMLSGVALGPHAGFLVGALSMLASNFMFGQGPWTPWQMLAYGLAGLVFGLLGRAGVVPRVPDPRAGGRVLTRRGNLALALAGALFVLVVVGPVLDTCSVFTMLSMLTPAGVLSIYAAGLPFNALQAAATFVTLLLAADPLLRAVARVARRYGIRR
jgi:energy-coupling factor transport system substrate-specific component